MLRILLAAVVFWLAVEGRFTALLMPAFSEQGADLVVGLAIALLLLPTLRNLVD